MEVQSAEKKNLQQNDYLWYWDSVILGGILWSRDSVILRICDTTNLWYRDSVILRLGDTFRHFFSTNFEKYIPFIEQSVASYLWSIV